MWAMIPPNQLPNVPKNGINLEMGRRMISSHPPSLASTVSPGNPNVEMVVAALKFSWLPEASRLVIKAIKSLLRSSREAMQACSQSKVQITVSAEDPATLQV